MTRSTASNNGSSAKGSPDGGGTVSVGPLPLPAKIRPVVFAAIFHSTTPPPLQRSCAPYHDRRCVWPRVGQARLIPLPWLADHGPQQRSIGGSASAVLGGAALDLVGVAGVTHRLSLSLSVCLSTLSGLSVRDCVRRVRRRLHMIMSSMDSRTEYSVLSTVLHY